MQEKSCANCKHSKNLIFKPDMVYWDCKKTPSVTSLFRGDVKEVFEAFYCSNYENVFIKDGEKNETMV